MDVEETVTTLEPDVAEQEVTEEAPQEEETPNPETAEGQEEQEEGDDDLEEVGIGGAKYKLPKEIAAAITGFNRDLTQKQQSVAEIRKEAEATLAEVHKEASLNRELIKEVAKLTSIESELEQYRNVNWEQEYARNPQAGALQARFLQLQLEHRQLSGHVEARKSEINASYESRVAKSLNEAVETLSKPDPDRGWDGKFDDSKRAKLTQFGLEFGFTREELEGTSHPLMIKGLQLMQIGQEYLKAKKTAPARTPAEPAAKVPTSRASSPINAKTASMAAYAAARNSGKLK